MPIGMFDSLITGHWFNAEAIKIWDDHATIQAWLDVEAALAQAQAELGIIPQQAADTIRQKADVAALDFDQLSQDIAHAQHPFVPVLRRFEALCGDPAAGYVHWGATTQNIFDTATALQMRKTHALLTKALSACVLRLAVLAQEHRQTLQAGRTHGQHALPMTFGYKVLSWLVELQRSNNRLNERTETSFVACMGGAIGTFAAMNGRGCAVEALMAQKLGLQPATVPARASFDRISDYLSALGLLAGSIEKLAQDIVFMQRSEVGEVEEAFHMGKMGSSTMAQKRNPSTALTLISLCRMVRSRVGLAVETMVRMDEGDSSATNIADITVREIAILAVSAAEMLTSLVQGLVVHADAMRRNLDLSGGLILAEAVMMQLSQDIGRHQAHHLLYKAAQQTAITGTPFLDNIEHELSHYQSSGQNVTLELDPASYLGEILVLIDRLAPKVG